MEILFIRRLTLTDDYIEINILCLPGNSCGWHLSLFFDELEIFKQKRGIDGLINKEITPEPQVVSIYLDKSNNNC